MGAERERLVGPDRNGFTPWHDWGPYVSERSWATVREDYSAGGDAWSFFPYDQARSRAYRWGEDGLAGICDRRQGLCLGLALWNGADPHLKERVFGLSNGQGNHGEDVKDYWWYDDAVPSNAWLSWRYHYPQARFPYEQLVDENARRGVDDPEFELADTGVFADGRYWVVTVDYAKAEPTDLLMRVRVRNAGPDPATLHVLPSLWARNTWSWGTHTDKPVLRADGDLVVAEHHTLGRWVLTPGPDPTGAQPAALFCDNETNAPRVFGSATGPAYPKDAINDHVVGGADAVNPERVGTKAAVWYVVEVDGGAEAELRLRFTRQGPVDGADALGPVEPGDLADGFTELVGIRRAEADEFYAELDPAETDPAAAAVMRAAYSGLLWSRQFYRYDVGRWLDGDPAPPPPPAGRGAVRNGGWRHLDANDVILMPDKWEYPWFASWDLAFHAVALARLDPAQAKQQLLLLTREWYLHPNGQLPAYEWDFNDANPPVHAWAAMRVFELDGAHDYVFLERMMHKLLINFTWWVNRQDAEGDNVFEGGFLGLDNIGPFNRSAPLPGGALLEQSDGTAWMAMYCLNLLEIALTLAVHDHSYEDLAVKFLEHFTLIADAMNSSGLWDEDDGFFYDVVRLSGGEAKRVKVRSMVGLIPLFALTVVPDEALRDLPEFVERAQWFVRHHQSVRGVIGRLTEERGSGTSLVSAVSPERLRRLLERVLSEEEFLSPHGLRSLSRWHRDHPFTLELDGVSSTVTYEPAESRSRLFGGNSNWRGPVWFPLNFLVIDGLLRYHRFLGPDFTVELPTGSGNQVSLALAAHDLCERLISTFLPGPDGRRPVHGGSSLFQDDPLWNERVWFYEYFNGDDGAGLGASHQTGWTALVGNLVVRRSGVAFRPDAVGLG